MLVTSLNDALELEVVPGECVYTKPMQDMPQGVFLEWSSLTQVQQERFTAVHEELAGVAAKLQALFLDEFTNMEGCVDGVA